MLRTSLIVGFPGETDENFTELKEFLQDYKLDNVGVFKYSREEETPAATMDNQVEEEIKATRERELMLVQKDVSKELNKLKMGRIYDTIIEGRKGKYFMGRNSEMAPEIDGLFYINSKEDIKIGDIVKVKVIETLEYDLVGDVCNEFGK